MTDKTKITKAIAFVIPILFVVSVAALALTAKATRADQVNMDISVNGTADLDITIDADDTVAREAIAGTQQDVYGTGVESTDTTTTTVPADGIETAAAETTTLPVNPVDQVFQDITSGAGSGYSTTAIGEKYLTMDQVCDDYYNPQNFQAMNSMAPADFVAQMKALGYDDETHINTIWNLCQQRYIDSQNQALQSSLSSGLSIMSSTEGTSNDIVNFITGAVKWLMGGGDAPEQYKAIGSALASYFASKQDLATVAENSYGNINRLNIRLEAVERTLERITPEEYCQVKVELMVKYNLSAVKCGENSTFYYKIPNPSSPTGYDLIGITELPGTATVPTSMKPAAAVEPLPEPEPVGAVVESQVVQLPEPLVIASQSPMSGNAVIPMLLKNLSNEALLNGFSNLSTNVSAALRGLSSSLPGAALQNLPTGMTGTTLFAGV